MGIDWLFYWWLLLYVLICLLMDDNASGGSVSFSLSCKKALDGFMSLYTRSFFGMNVRVDVIIARFDRII